MQHHGVKFEMGAKGQRFVKGKSHKVGVHYKASDGSDAYEEYDTVLLAIGRTGDLALCV